MKLKYEELRLREPEIQPTDEVLAKVLGDSYGAYKTFCKELADLELEQVWQFYPCVGTKAWMARGVFKWTTPRGAKKEKNLYWLSVWEKYIKISVWFKGSNRAEVLKLNISNKTKNVIAGAKIMGEKMNTFPVEFEVTTAEQLADIYELIQCKKRLEAF